MSNANPRNSDVRFLFRATCFLLAFMITSRLASNAAEVPDCGGHAGQQLSEKIWRTNLEIVIDVMAGKSRGNAVDEFPSAVLFFERVTGIDYTMSFGFRLSTPILSEVLKQWEAWFQDNRAKPGFDSRVCRAFRNIQIAEKNLRDGNAGLAFVMNFWVYSSNEWDQIINHVELGRVTTPIKALELSADGEFAFVECAVTVAKRSRSLFVELERRSEFKVYLGTWQLENGLIVVRYRLYDSWPETRGRSLPGPEQLGSLVWREREMTFRGFDFYSERNIPIPNLNIELMSFVDHVKEKEGFYFRD